MAGHRSPLKDKPLRNPGQSLDEEIQRVIDEQPMAPYAAIVMLWTMALAAARQPEGLRPRSALGRPVGAVDDALRCRESATSYRTNAR